MVFFYVSDFNPSSLCFKADAKKKNHCPVVSQISLLQIVSNFTKITKNCFCFNFFLKYRFYKKKFPKLQDINMTIVIKIIDIHLLHEGEGNMKIYSPNRI